MKDEIKDNAPIAETQYWWSMQVFMMKEDHKNLNDDALKKLALLQMQKNLLKHMTIKDYGRGGKVCELNGKIDSPENGKEKQWNSTEVINLLKQVETLPYESAMYVLKHIKLKQDGKEWRDLRNYLKKYDKVKHSNIITEKQIEWSSGEIPKPIKLTPEQKDWILWEIRDGLRHVYVNFEICGLGTYVLGIQRDKALYLLTNLCEQDDDNTVLDLSILEDFYDRFGKF